LLSVLFGLACEAATIYAAISSLKRYSNSRKEILGGSHNAQRDAQRSAITAKS